ncbi:MAG: cyclopropane-fatty-acyl-phospholipid synthase family protein [Pseudomonadota bacterium]
MPETRSEPAQPEPKGSLTRVRRALALVRGALDLPVAVRLWDGSVEPLGAGQVRATLCLNAPGVVPSLLRYPSLDRLIRHYAQGRIDLEGGTLLDVAGPLALDREARRRLKALRWPLLRTLAPLALARGEPIEPARAFEGDAEGQSRRQGDNRRFIGFHYDVGNDFYALFLDPQMQYSCAYFPDESTDLATAQHAKLDMICRKLRLRPGERFLDIGCGWGGLLRHAVRHYGVVGHGVTLSEEQRSLALARAEAEGLSDRITIELCDYASLEGRFDKIASVGMAEHVGLANLPAYFAKMRALLAEDGLFLNHAITRRAKRGRGWRRARFSARPEQRALQRYIFPGGELDDIGATVAAMERAGFEVHDVEGWRRHYERTTREWCERLTTRRAEAEALVGPEAYRLWVAYLAGCSLAFRRGSARIFQTVASHSARGTPPLPPTRADLYR